MRSSRTGPTSRLSRSAALVFKAAAALTALAPVAASAQSGDPLYDYGEHLAKQCNACHPERAGDAAKVSGAPDIISMPYEEFAARFVEAKKSSPNPVLRLTLEGLTDDDVKAILYYFSKRPR